MVKGIYKLDCQKTTTLGCQKSTKHYQSGGPNVSNLLTDFEFPERAKMQSVPNPFLY